MLRARKLLGALISLSLIKYNFPVKMQVSKIRSFGTPPSNVPSFEFPKSTRGSGDDTNAQILIILPSFPGDAW